MRPALRIVCYLLWPLLSCLLRPFFPKRLAFERKNPLAPPPAQRAHIAFEVSSEGELEQIQFLLEDVLNMGKRVELIYCSESVEKNVERLLQRFPHHLRAFRLPLLTSRPLTKPASSALHFLTAPVLILCRYDFFPELLLYGLTRARLFVLLSGSLKGKGGIWARPYRSLLRRFDLIVPASSGEAKRFESLLGRPVFKEMDLRVLRIHRRLQKAPKTFQARQMEAYIDFIQRWPKANRILLAQFYASEIDVLSSPALLKALADGNFLLCICPHSSSPEEREGIVHGAQKLLGAEPRIPPLQVIGEDELREGRFSQTHLLALRGVLCELYPFFPASYIGGGFGRSVHSVLEPFLADSLIICGPKVHRSSEYEYIQSTSAQRTAILREKKQFFSTYESVKKGELSPRNSKFTGIMEARYRRLRGELLDDISQ